MEALENISCPTNSLRRGLRSDGQRRQRLRHEHVRPDQQRVAARDRGEHGNPIDPIVFAVLEL